MAAGDVQRKVQVLETGAPRRYAVGTEPVLKPGHVTYMRATESDPHAAVRLAHNSPGRRPPRARAAAPGPCARRGPGPCRCPGRQPPLPAPGRQLSLPPRPGRAAGAAPGAAGPG